jgi:hypothetical protein
MEDYKIELILTDSKGNRFVGETHYNKLVNINKKFNISGLDEMLNKLIVEINKLDDEE